MFEFPNVWSSPKSEVGNAEEEESNEKRDWKLHGSFRSVEEIETREKEGEFGDGNANAGVREKATASIPYSLPRANPIK